MLDSITHLPIRQEFLRALDERVTQRDATGALLLIRITALQEINRLFGFETGDAVLRSVAEGLRGLLRDGDLAGRIGGATFGLVLTGVSDTGHASLAANRVQRLLAEQIESDGDAFPITAAIGGALFPLHGTHAETLFREAEDALDECRGGESTSCFARTAPEAAGPPVSAGQLRIALNARELEVAYQPQVQLRGGQCRSVEALARWHDARLGDISPSAFIPLAEDAGLIGDLTAWVLNTALRQYPQLHAAGIDRISVNLSAALLESLDTVTMVQSALAVWDMPPEALVLEITEGSIIRDPARSREILKRLHASGVGLSVDDFGTGYSSLAYLKQLPLDELKIDKSFVLRLAESKDDRKIAASVIDLGHHFDLRVVAEGVETERARDIVQALDCDLAQGFLYSKALPLERLFEWTRRSGPAESRRAGTTPDPIP